MQEEKLIRINKILRELNISLDRAVDYLLDHNISIEKSPNAKITEEEYNILLDRFNSDKVTKEASKVFSIKDLQQALGIKLEKVNEIIEKTNVYVVDSKNNVVQLAINCEDIDIYYLKEFKKLFYLQITAPSIKGLQYLQRFDFLTTLILKSENLSNITALRNLKKITDLSIHGQIGELASIGHLLDLENLNLSKNRLNNLRPLEKLVKLKRLVLHSNKISNLSVLGNLSELEILDLANNYVNDIRPLSSLQKLKELDLSQNQIKSTSVIGFFTELEELNLSHNPISDLGFLPTETLKTLHLNSVESQSLSFLTNFPNLSFFNANNCAIEDISELKNLQHLQILALAGNLIEDLTPIEKLEGLNVLLLSNNQIKDISPLQHLKNLTSLFISNNRISDIRSLNRLNNLKQLLINDNEIEDVTPLSGLTSLTYLDLSGNKITSLKPLDSVISSIHRITISNNPIIENQGWKLTERENHLNLIKNYLSTLKDDLITYTLPAKVLLLGNHGSGKSTLLDFLLQDKTKPRTVKNNTDSTHIIKIENFPKFSDTSTLPNVIFFDFGGQDYYHGIYKAFLTNDALNLLLWNEQNDLNNLRKDTRDFSRNYWLHQLKYYFDKNKKEGESEPILLIQTRADEEGSIRLTYKNNDDQKFMILNEFHIALNQEAIESNKTFSASLDFLEIQIDDEIEKKQKKISRPEWYGNFVKYILSSQKEHATKLEEVRAHYARDKKENETESDLIEFLKDDLDQLHKKGLVLYYKQDMPDVVWLNPMKTVQYIHDDVLSKDKLKIANGLIEKDKFSVDKNIINLLQLQKVIFFDKSENVYIIPNFLSLSESVENKYDIITFGLNKPEIVLKFKDFLPFGIVNQLICHFGQNPDSKHFWRDQIIFTLNKEARILIKLNFNDLKIDIYFGFLNNNINRQEQIKRYIFYCIISLYWDNEVVNFDTYCTLQNLFLDKIDIYNNINLEHILPKNTDELKKLKLKNLENLVFRLGDDNIKIDKSHNLQLNILWDNISIDHLPEDLYLSTDGINFIESLEFQEGISNQTPFINSYKFAGNHISKNAKLTPLYYYSIFTNNKINKMQKAFISYSKSDLALVNDFLDHLSSLKRDGLISTWYCTELTPGGEWNDDILRHFEESDIVFFMVSPNFMRTNYIFDYEVAKAFEKRKFNSKFKIIPIILDFCSWTTNEHNLGQFTALPYTAKPICDFNNRNMAWFLVVESLKYMIRKDEQPENEDWFYDQVELPANIRKIYERIVKGAVDNNSL